MWIYAGLRSLGAYHINRTIGPGFCVENTKTVRSVTSQRRLEFVRLLLVH